MKKLAVLLLIAVALVLPLTAGGSKDSSSSSASKQFLHSQKSMQRVILQLSQIMSLLAS